MLQSRYLVFFIVSIFLLLSLSESIDSEKVESPPVEKDESKQDGGGGQSKFSENDNKDDDATVVTEDDKTEDSSKEDETVEYGQGSVCVYCQYCKFCKLCDKDCPCKTSKRKPNCHMCKYCSYCNLCTSVCDNFCKPGSFLDTISSAIFKALPKFDTKMKNEVDKDIESVKKWIKSYL